MDLPFEIEVRRGEGQEAFNESSKASRRAEKEIQKEIEKLLVEESRSEFSSIDKIQQKRQIGPISEKHPEGRWEILTFYLYPPFDSSWSPLEVALHHTPISWEGVFREALEDIERASHLVLQYEAESGMQSFPLRENLFRAYDLTPLNRVRVVILGQDPYYTTANDGFPRAQGLAFSVRKQDQPVPPSLRNIYKEIANVCPDFVIPDHGNLEGWAKQGVLLLNSCLTVTPNQAASHGSIWQGLVVKTIKAVIDNNPYAIFVLWGAHAQGFEKSIHGKTPTLKASHPSPLSAYKGFFGCGHFRIINERLTELGQIPIDWQV